MAVATLLKSEVPNYNVTLPVSGKDLSFRPYKVKEEKVLLLALQEGTENAILNGIKRLIESCVDGIEDAGELVMADLEFLFLNLRAKSAGQQMEPNMTCPITEKHIPVKIDIAKLELSNEAPENKIQLTENVGLSLTLPTLNIINKTSESNVLDFENDIEQFFNLISLCIVEIWSENEVFKAQEISSEDRNLFIESMTVEQFDKVLDFFKEAPKLQYKLKYKVPYDPTDGEQEVQENEIILEGINDFFG
tara:strand:+ start:609 stop:1355 length:747 start_codon:yes stop_codon:yes gene_type:complete